MKRKLWICALVCGLTVLFCVGAGLVQRHAAPNAERYIDHIVNGDADPTLGVTAIPADRMVGEDFVSHLPLVVIDTGGQEIVSYKKYVAETDAFEVPAGIDPYFSMHIRVYDNAGHRNCLSDEPSLSSDGRIKVRGNSSANPLSGLPKYQYTLKLENEEGEEQPLSMMGIGTDDTWVLSPTVHDKSRIRNYLVYNIAGQVEASTPDLRYCEVLFARDGGYYYGGLYMMCESVKVSPERVNIQKDASGYHVGSGYLLSRDRYSEDEITLDTWGTREGYNTHVDINSKKQETVFSLEYPKNGNATPEAIADIEKEISQIEMLLYNQDSNSWNRLGDLVDLESFADYLVLNEFFCNYDAGLHSTYMYKAPWGKLTAGPYWDYDGAMDNWHGLLDFDAFVFYSYPWYEALVQMEEFDQLVEHRYSELRKTVLDDDYLAGFIDGTVRYLGNALLREDSAFGDYSYITSPVTEESTGLSVDQRRDTGAEEAQCVKDVLHLRGAFMDENISMFQEFSVYHTNSSVNTIIASLLIMVFLVSTVLVRRYRQIR